MLTHVKKVTTPTKTAANLLEKAGLQKEIHVISCGVDLKKFHPNQDATGIRKRFKIPEKPILLYAGRLDKEKNLDIVLHAFRIARKQVDAHFIIVGRGAEKARLEALANSLGIINHVTFTDYLSDEEYPKVHGLADCFVNACTAELQSIVALEAIASGLPLLGANAMALPELVIAGKNGHLFAPGDTQELAKQIVDVLSNPEKRKKMGIESRNMAELHDIASTAEQYERLYEEMLTS